MRTAMLDRDELAWRVLAAQPFTFDAAFVPLVLDGRKTQSRRLDRKFASGDLFFVRSSTGATYDGRLFEITRVWAQPVRDISNADALDDGVLHIEAWPSNEYLTSLELAKLNGTKPPLGPSPRERFRRIIERQYPGIWKSNGLVWVHEWRSLISETSANDEK